MNDESRQIWGESVNISLAETEEHYEIFFFFPILDLCQVIMTFVSLLRNTSWVSAKHTSVSIGESDTYFKVRVSYFTP
jgi:hypothetical protein